MPENSRQQVKAEFKQAIVDTGRTIIREGLTVSTFGNISVTHFAGLDEVDTIITDNGISEECRKILTDRGIELIIADQEDTN